MSLNWLHYPIVFSLLKKNLKAQIQKHKLKDIVFVLFGQVFKLNIILVEFSIHKLKRGILGLFGGLIVFFQLFRKKFIATGFFWRKYLIRGRRASIYDDIKFAWMFLMQWLTFWDVTFVILIEIIHEIVIFIVQVLIIVFISINVIP